jgi:hypothetical protein
MSMRLGVLGALISAAALGASCATIAARTPSVPRLEVDSIQYHIAVSDTDAVVVIPFRYVNGDAVASSDYCKVVAPPGLEKLEGGSWIAARGTPTLSCQHLPPFRLAPRAIYSGVVRAHAWLRGTSMYPQWRVTSFPGEYRLHWTLVAESTPQRPNAERIDVVSPSFHIVAAR